MACMAAYEPAFQAWTCPRNDDACTGQPGISPACCHNTSCTGQYVHPCAQERCTELKDKQVEEEVEGEVEEEVGEEVEEDVGEEVEEEVQEEVLAEVEEEEQGR